MEKKRLEKTVKDAAYLLQQIEKSHAMVRGAIIGALHGGHMEGPEGYEYSKHILLQIAGFLDFDIPGFDMTGYKANPEQEDEDDPYIPEEIEYADKMFLPQDPELD